MTDIKNLMGADQTLTLAQLSAASTYQEARRSLLSVGVPDQIESLQSVLKPLDVMRKQSDAFLNLYPDVQAALAATGDPYKSFRDAAEKNGFMDGFFRNVVGADISWAREQMERLAGAAKPAEMLATMNSLFFGGPEPFSSRAFAANYLDDSRELMVAAAQHANLLSSYQAISADIERLITPQGAASIQSYWEGMLKLNEHRGAVGLLDESPLLNAEAVNQIVQGFKAVQEPQHRWILVGIFLPILILLVSPFWSSYVDFHMKKHLEGAPTQSANKQVKEAAREAVGDLRLLRDYRFVTAQSLAVRAEPKARGQTLGQLHLGQTVYVLGKERDFTLVTWRSENGNAQLQGWVFSRHLKRFQ